MRRAINENPIAQVVIIGVLAIVVGFLFLTRIAGSSEEPEPAATEATATPAAPTGSAASAAPLESGVPASPTQSAEDAPAPDVEAASVPPATADSGFVAGPGLPKAVVRAFDGGDVVVLLVTKPDGIEDKRVRDDVEALRNRPDTAVFVTDTNDVARYSRIAQGVDLDRAPALVVIQPKRLADGGLPQASVDYGFRKSDSVNQAVRDALYKGRELPYHPG